MWFSLGRKPQPVPAPQPTVEEPQVEKKEEDPVSIPVKLYGIREEMIQKAANEVEAESQQYFENRSAIHPIHETGPVTDNLINFASSIPEPAKVCTCSERECICNSKPIDDPNSPFKKAVQRRKEIHEKIAQAFNSLLKEKHPELEDLYTLLGDGCFNEYKFGTPTSIAEQSENAPYTHDGGHRGYFIEDNGELSLDGRYIEYLVEQSKFKTKPVWEGENYKRKVNGQYKAPPIIGLWLEEPIYDEWLGFVPPPRQDKADDYFTNLFHPIQSYIDDEWPEEEKKKIYKYLFKYQNANVNLNAKGRGAAPALMKEPEKLNLFRGSSPSQLPVFCSLYQSALTSAPIRYGKGCGVRTDGKYIWHESLLDYVRFYNVRPPQFFVDHILSKIEELKRHSDNSIKAISRKATGGTKVRRPVKKRKA